MLKKLKVLFEIFYLRFLINSPSKRAEYLKIKKGYKLGKNCEVFSGVSFGSEPYLIEIGNNVKLTDGVQLITHDGGVYVLRNLGYCENGDKFGQIKISDNVFIGNGSTVLPGVKIGKNCLIGAKSVVTKDIPDNSVVAGVPARIVCTIDEYWNKNKHRIDNTKNLSLDSKKAFLYNKFNIEV